MTLLAALFASYGGFACMALGTSRIVQRLGAMPLLAALMLCWWRDGPALGTVLWVMLLILGAFGAAMTVTLLGDKLPSRKGREHVP
jgi:hypothetical protein